MYSIGKLSEATIVMSRTWKITPSPTHQTRNLFITPRTFEKYPICNRT